MFLILLIINFFIIIFSEPPFAATWIVDYIFGFSGVVLISAGLWWVLALTSIAALRVHWSLSLLLVALTVVMWMLNIITPLGSMALALYFPLTTWFMVEIFFLVPLLILDILLLRLLG